MSDLDKDRKPAPSSRSSTRGAEYASSPSAVSSTARGAEAPQPAPSSRSSLRSLLTRPITFGPDVEAPVVRMLYPTEFEQLHGGEEVLLRWSSKDNVGVVAQVVQLSLDDGRTYQDISPELSGSVQSLVWTVPNVATNVGRIKVIAIDQAGNRGFASSRSPFVIEHIIIKKPAVKLLAPQGRQVLRSGYPVTISWRTVHAAANVRFDLHLSLNGGQSYTPLARNLPSTIQSLRWTIPGITTRCARLRLIMRGSDGVLAEDSSTDDLAIYARTGEFRAVFSGQHGAVPPPGSLPAAPGAPPAANPSPAAPSAPPVISPPPALAAPPVSSAPPPPPRSSKPKI